MKFFKWILSAIRYLWSGIKVFGGVGIWLAIVAVVCIIFGCITSGVTAVLALLLPHLVPLSATLLVAKWTAIVVAVACALVTAYAAWVNDDSEDQAEPQR